MLEAVLTTVAVQKSSKLRSPVQGKLGCSACPKPLACSSSCHGARQSLGVACPLVKCITWEFETNHLWSLRMDEGSWFSPENEVDWSKDSESQALKEMSAGKGQHGIKLSLTFCSYTDFILCCQVTRHICLVLTHLYISPQSWFWLPSGCFWTCWHCPAHCWEWRLVRLE